MHANLTLLRNSQRDNQILIFVPFAGMMGMMGMMPMPGGGKSVAILNLTSYM